MKAVVLVGGEGTRMRPLTETIPKPLLPLLDRRSLDHVLDHLARHGVHEVVLSSPYLEETFHPFIEARRRRPRHHVDHRDGGARDRRGGRERARPGGRRPFFALNGDILTDLDLTAMLASHREREASVTIALHHVEDARAFGLVATEPDGRVLGVPREAAGLDPRRHQRGHVPAGPRGDPVLGAGRERLDRARDLPRGDRERAQGVRLRFGRVLARPRYAREVPAGAFRHDRGQGARPVVPGALDRRWRRCRPARASRPLGGSGGERARRARRPGGRLRAPAGVPGGGPTRSSCARSSRPAPVPRTVPRSSIPSWERTPSCRPA